MWKFPPARPVPLLLLYLAAAAVHLALALTAPPTVAIYNDEIIFKALSRDFHETGAFRFGEPYRVNVPPLYPIVLSAAHRLGDPVAIHRGMLTLNVLAFFTAIFPIYGIARRLLGHADALVAAALTAFLPQAVFTSWIMSEALFFPLFAAALWMLLLAMDGRRGAFAALGLLLAACILARHSGLLLAGLLLAVAFRMGGHSAGTIPPWRAAGYCAGALVIAALVVVPVWAGLGYLATGIGYQPPATVPYQLAGQLADLTGWTGVNAIGLMLGFGVLLPLLACIGGSAPGGRPLRDFQFLLAATVTVLVLGAAWTTVEIQRSTPDFWHPITRYLFHAAPLLLPAAVYGWRQLAEGRYLGWRPPAVAAGALALLSATLWFSHRRLHSVRMWFADAPDLEWYRHIGRGSPRPAGEWTALMIFLAATVLLVLLCRRFPRMALVLTALVLLNVKIQATDYQYRVQHKHVERYAAVQSFALSLARGEVADRPIVTDASDDMNRPLGLLHFWTRSRDLGPGWAMSPEGSHYVVTTEPGPGALVATDGRWQVRRVGDPALAPPSLSN